jgi:hypothetical protein
MGPDDVMTLNTRHNIAGWTGRCGDRPGALLLFEELLPDMVRVLGPDHPDTLTTRDNIAASTAQCGDRPGALLLYEELLPDMVRVLGPDHPNTLATRSDIAALTDPPRAEANRPKAQGGRKRRRKR